MTMPPDPKPTSRLPVILLFVFSAAFTVTVGLGWLPQSPTNEELYGGAARFLFEFWNNLRAAGGIPWWSPNYLLGYSMAGLAMCALPISCGLAAVSLFGDPAGIKIAALAVLPLSALTMFVFVRRLSGSAWSALAAALLYMVSAQMIARLADFQHWMGAYAYIFPPLILWGFLRVADERSLRAAAWLAFAWAAMMLSYTKLAFLFLPIAAAFVLWLWVCRPGSRPGLALGTLAALPAIFLLAVVPLLPLAREFPLVAAFEFDPFDIWQQSFVLKNFAAVFDRDNALFAGTQAEFLSDRGQFYLGACVFLAVAWYFWSLWRATGWSASRDGIIFRVFSGIALLALWLSHGPIPPIDGVLRTAAAAAHAKWLSIPVILAATALPLVFLWTLLSRTPRRKWVMAFLVPVWFVIPGFAVLEILPPLRGIRAPWGYWEVGFFAAAVAAAAAAKGLFESIRVRSARVILGATLGALLVFDMSPYLAKFTAPGLPTRLFEDFSAAQRSLAASPVPGRVLVSTSRYFSLRTPLESGRPLVTESSWQHLQLRGARELFEAGFTNPELMRSFLRIGGTSHILSEKKDPAVTLELSDSLATWLPEVSDSEYFRLQENPEALFPAFTARDYIAVDPGAKNLSLEFLSIAALQNVVPVELGPNAATFPFLAGTAGASTGVFLPALDLRKPSPPFARRDYASPRTSPMHMEFPPTPGPGWLVVSEAWHPDWKAFSGKDPVPVYKAFGTFLAIPLDRGREPLRLEFSPPAWYHLCIKSALASWIVLAALILLMPVAPRRLRDLWSGPMENLIPACILAEIRRAGTRWFIRHDPST
jgi:hypothetical protein